MSLADTTAAPAMRRAPDVVDEILAHADERWVPLDLPGGTLGEVRPGGTVVIMGPTGGGKSSKAAQIGVRHARERGPAIIMSCELPADELAARMAGMQLEASWPGVLRGEVSERELRRVLDLRRLAILDRQNATLETLGRALVQVSDEYTEEPILVVIDYVQIVPAPGDDPRHRVGDVMAAIDALARRHRAVAIVVSQMSRASSRAARAGESMGAETADGGAETAAIERYATMTITIGQAQPAADDGSKLTHVSVGKGRMGGGDRVYPLRFDGRTGRWAVEGDGRPADEVRAEAQAERENGRISAAAIAMQAAAERATEPQSREQLRQAAACSRDVGRAALAQLLETGDLVEVRQRRGRSRYQLVWTRARAAEAEIEIVEAADAA